MFEQITVLILTYNEAPNIKRTLDSLSWARKILIIDSFSTDETLKIAANYPRVKVIQNPFSTFAQQCNFGLSRIDTKWVLSIDADYVFPEALQNEIKSLEAGDFDGFEASFKYCVYGEPLKGTLYPSRKVLYKKEKAIYAEDGHAHRVQISGKIGYLQNCIHHDDRKPLSRWLISQDNYMKAEFQKITSVPAQQLGFNDRIRKQKLLAPFAVFFYCLILKKGIFDGWRGWYYAFQRMLAETLLSIRLLEEEVSRKE